VGVANGVVGLLPAYALSRFGAGDAGIGMLLAARGLGALVGPFVARGFAGGSGQRLLVACGTSIVTFAAAYVLLPLPPAAVVASVLIFSAHRGGGAEWTLSTYGLQVAVPDELRGRVLSLDFGVATLAIGLSALAAGGAAEAFGLDAAVWGLAGIGLVYGAAWL